MIERRLCDNPIVTGLSDGQDIICPDPFYKSHRPKESCGLCPKKKYFNRSRVFKELKGEKAAREIIFGRR